MNTFFLVFAFVSFKSMKKPLIFHEFQMILKHLGGLYRLEMDKESTF